MNKVIRSLACAFVLFCIDLSADTDTVSSIESELLRYYNLISAAPDEKQYLFSLAQRHGIEMPELVELLYAMHKRTESKVVKQRTLSSIWRIWEGRSREIAEELIKASTDSEEQALIFSSYLRRVSNPKNCFIMEMLHSGTLMSNARGSLYATWITRYKEQKDTEIDNVVTEKDLIDLVLNETSSWIFFLMDRHLRETLPDYETVYAKKRLELVKGFLEEEEINEHAKRYFMEVVATATQYDEKPSQTGQPDEDDSDTSEPPH